MKHFKKMLAVVLSVMMLTGLMTGITFAEDATENTVDVTVTYDYNNYTVYQGGEVIENGTVIKAVPGQDYTFEVALTEPVPTYVDPETETTTYYPQQKYFNYYVNSKQINEKNIDISEGKQSVTVQFDKESVFAVAYTTLNFDSSKVARRYNTDYGTSWEIAYLDNYSEAVPYGTDYKFYIKIDKGYIESAKAAKNLCLGKTINSVLYLGYYDVTNEWKGVGRGYTDGIMWNEDGSDPDNGIYCYSVKNLTSVLTIRVAQYGNDVPANMTLLQPSTVNVNFYNDEAGTEKYTTTTAKYDSVIDEPEDPTKDGYSFDGWYTEDGEKYDFSSPVKTLSDINLYAHWSKNYTVSFISFGETIDEVEVKNGECVKEPAKPVKSGYTFSGWYDSEKYTQKYDFETPVTADINLYAKWEGNVAQTITAKAATTKAVVGQKDTITVTGAKTTLSYKSSNTAIATVSSKGIITPKSAGKVTITVTAAAKDQYKAATTKVTIKVYPKATNITYAKNTASKKVTLKWKKIAGVTGYQVFYKTGSTSKKVNVKGATNVKKVLSKLTKGKTYSFKVRSYSTVSGTTYYSSWSAVKKVKITK